MFPARCRRWLFAAMLVSGPLQAAPAVLPADAWAAVVEAGQSLVTLAPLREVMQRFEAQAGSRILIRYPGGDVGSAWANDVRDGLVALGVASARIDLEPGSGSPTIILIDVISGTYP